MIDLLCLGHALPDRYLAPPSVAPRWENSLSRQKEERRKARREVALISLTHIIESLLDYPIGKLILLMVI